jgi:hypothetical protein
MGDIVSFSDPSRRRSGGAVLERPPSDGSSAQATAETLDERRSFTFLIKVHSGQLLELKLP